RASLRQAIDARAGARQAETAALTKQAAELDGYIAQGNRNLALLPDDRIPGVVEQIRAWERQRADLSGRLAALDAEAAEEGTGHADGAEQALALLGRLEELVAEADRARVRAALAPLVRKVTLHFRAATAADRRARNGNCRYVPCKLTLEPSALLLKLLNP